MEIRDNVVAGADRGRPDWYVAPVGGEYVETRRSRDLHQSLETLSRSERRRRFEAVQALLAVDAPGPPDAATT